MPNTGENDDQPGLTYSWGTGVFISPTVVYNGGQHTHGSHSGTVSGGLIDSEDGGGQQDSTQHTLHNLPSGLFPSFPSN